MLPAVGAVALLVVGATACVVPRAPRPELPRALQQGIPERGYDVEHYAIDLELAPAQRRIQGSCTIRLASTRAALEEVVLDFVGLDVQGVTDERGTLLGYVHEGETLTVVLDEPLAEGELCELSVRYAGTPITGLWFSGQRPDGSGPNQAFTQGQADESRGWFPCFDHPSDRATSEVRVTMPAHWVSVAPGELVDESEDGLVRTQHWRMDTAHPAYLVSLVAGEYVVQEDEWAGVPLLVFAEARYTPWLEASFHETDEILDFLSEYTGIRYPYPKYSQAVVANFPWGGMENISATTLTPLTLDDERGRRDEESHGLVAHEAAHQWFGDLLTCRDWSHVWLNEGFATYMTQLYFEESRGVDEFRARVRDLQDEYVRRSEEEGRRPVVTSVYKEPEDLLDFHVYHGAAVRLHLLRFLLGDEAFREGIRTYAAENAGRGVVTEDFRRVMERVSERDLGLFFEQWFYSPGHPEFLVDWEWDRRRRRVELDVRQVQASAGGTPAAFHVPVAIEVRDSRGTVRHRLQLDERNESFVLPADERPFYVRFDKGGWIPKHVRFRDRSASEWLAIATSDDDVNGRRDAVRALGAIAEQNRTSDLAVHDVHVAELGDRLARDESPWVRAEAAAALGRAGGLEARERLIHASGADPSAKVRVAALEALRAWGESPELSATGKARFAEGYSWKTMAAAAGLVCRAAPDSAYEWITQKLFVDSPHDQLAGMLFEHLGSLDDPAVPDQLLRWARDEAVHPSARAEAVRALAEQDRARPRIARELVPLLETRSFRLAKAVVESLAELGGPAAREALEAHYSGARSASERRAIEAVLRKPPVP